MTKEELKPIDTSKYKITETGQVLKMTKDALLTPEKIMNSEEIRIVKQLSRAKEIIKDLLQVLPKENVEGVYEVTEEAEQFLREEN